MMTSSLNPASPWHSQSETVKVATCDGVVEAHAPSVSGCCSSCAWDDGFEDARSNANVKPTAEFVEVQRKVVARHLFERPHDAPLDDRPEAINVRDGKLPTDVFFSTVTYRTVLVTETSEGSIGEMFIGGDECHLVGSCALDEAGDSDGNSELCDRCRRGQFRFQKKVNYCQVQIEKWSGGSAPSPGGGTARREEADRGEREIGSPAPVLSITILTPQFHRHGRFRPPTGGSG